MSDKKDLLRAICEYPKEDTPRLMYADWLEERGEDYDRDRAEFIRLQIELARPCGKCDPKTRKVFTRGPYDPIGADVYPNGYFDNCDACGEGCTKEKRVDDLLSWNGSEWLREVGLHHPMLSAGFELPTGAFDRGFVNWLRCTAAVFYGATCGVCRGGGELTQNLRTPPKKCYVCGGMGYFDGLVNSIFETCPLEKVDLHDRVPRVDDYDVTPAGGGRPRVIERRWVWDCGAYSGARHPTFLPRPAVVPPGTFDYLADPDPVRVHLTRSSSHHRTADGAREELSRACVKHGRHLAGLDPYAFD